MTAHIQGHACRHEALEIINLDLLYEVQNISLNGTHLFRVVEFIYLGNWVTEDLKDILDIEWKRRSMAIVGNMLA